MAEEQNTFSVLMFPWIAHGHISPYLELSKELLKRNFKIYFCSTAVNLDSIKTSIGKDLPIKLVQLHMPSLPQLPPELHTTKNLPYHLFPVLMHAFQESRSSFSEIMKSLKPDLLIYDHVQPWAPKIASSQGIPAVYFSTFGPAASSFYHHVHYSGIDSIFPYPELYLLDHEKSVLRNIFAVLAQLIKDADDDYSFGTFARSTEIVLVKGCRAVEQKYIDYLSISGKKKIVPTGPLIAYAKDSGNQVLSGTSNKTGTTEGRSARPVENPGKEQSDIINWLTGKENCSTLYISFGSEYFPSKEQMAEIAKALQLSDANFIWVISFPVEQKSMSVEESLPAGFVEMVKERGVVVTGWAPQKEILAHPSIAGFVSHCGWSSVMESMYFGVPIIAMPMQAEQPINARFVVAAGAGLEVRKEGDGCYLRPDIAEVMNKMIADEKVCGGLRDRAEEISEKIRQNGEQEVNEAIEQLLRLCVENKQQHATPCPRSDS